MRKNIFMLIVFLAGVMSLTAQETVYYPIVDSKSDSNFEITSILVNDAETTITFVLDCKSQLLYMSFKPERTFIQTENGRLAYSRSSKINVGYQTIRRGDRIEFSITFNGVLPKNMPFKVIIGDAFEDTSFSDVEFKTNTIGELRRGADLGNKDALNGLALKYYNGDGVSEDYEKALSLFIKSAENGLPIAHGNVGSLYLWGKGANMNTEKARQWFEAGDKLGDSHSQYFLGTMYCDGNGVLKNPQKAKEYFLKSATSGNINAQYSYALLCKQNNQLADAFNWFSKSAEGGYASAQYELGLMYYYGKGTTKNTAQAAYWIKKAYESGHAGAKDVWNGLELWKYENDIPI